VFAECRPPRHGCLVTALVFLLIGWLGLAATAMRCARLVFA
jgi:hypothetical protein